MKFPTKFKYMSQEYEIKYASQEEIDKLTDHNVWGRVAYKEGTITIIKDAIDDCKLEILLHEIFHVIFTQSGTRLEDIEESVIEAISYGLIEAFRQNKWMKEMFDED